MRPMAEATTLLATPDALREQADRDGYLLLRGLLPGDAVAAAGREIAAVLAEAGWIPKGANLADAPADPKKFCVEPQSAFMDVFYRLLSLRSLHALKQHSALMAAAEALFGEAPFATPHFVMRMAFPSGEDFATPAHQDFVHFEGSRKNWAAWIPFAPVDHARGGLAVAAGSHKLGPLDMRPALGAGQMAIDRDLSDLDWRWSPFEPGDVLLHNCLNVHKGRANQSNNLRVSMDCRFQPMSEPVGEKYLGVSHQMRSWDDLYAGWDDDAYKYYWRNLDLTVEPFSYRWYDRRDERAIQIGAAGDPVARIALENIILKHRDPAMRKQAEAALAALSAQSPLKP